MLVKGSSLFISARSGAKNGRSWFMLKFLDEDADEFFSAFTEERLYEQLEGTPKRTPVLLTLNIVPGQKYFAIENIEINAD